MLLPAGATAGSGAGGNTTKPGEVGYGYSVTSSKLTKPGIASTTRGVAVSRGNGVSVADSASKFLKMYTDLSLVSKALSEAGEAASASNEATGYISSNQSVVAGANATAELGKAHIAHLCNASAAGGAAVAGINCLGKLNATAMEQSCSGQLGTNSSTVAATGYLHFTVTSQVRELDGH